MDELWREEESSPARIEAALRRMTWRGGGAEDESRPLPVPARVLNLVAIVDAGLREEIENRLRRLGSLHPSRVVVCAVQEGRRRLTVRGGVSAAHTGHLAGRVAIAYERVEITLGPQHLPTLDTIVDLLLARDLPTMVWSPRGHDEGVEALRRLAQVVLIDSHEGPDAAERARARDRPRPRHLRRRPGLAALDAVARARGGAVRPDRPAPGPRAITGGVRPPS